MMIKNMYDKEKITPSLGVIIPIYDNLKAFKFLLEGLSNQYNFSNFYTLVINDNPGNKEIKEICNLFKNELHIVYFENKYNIGPGLSRNIGINWCQRNNIDYIMFLDGDDFIAPGGIRYFLNSIIKNNADLVINNFSAVYSNYEYELSNGLNNLFFIFSKIYKTSAINDIRFENVKIAEDILFNLKFLDNNDKYVYFLNGKNPVYYHLFYEGSLSTLPKKATCFKDSLYYNMLIVILKYLSYSKNQSIMHEFNRNFIFENLYQTYEKGVYFFPNDKKHFDDVVNKIIQDVRIQDIFNDITLYLDQNMNFNHVPFCFSGDYSGGSFSSIDEITKICFFQETLIDFLKNHNFIPNFDFNILKNNSYMYNI